MITIMKTPSNITIAPSKASKDDPPPLSEIDIDRLQISQQDLRILEILALRFWSSFMMIIDQDYDDHNDDDDS